MAKTRQSVAKNETHVVRESDVQHAVQRISLTESRFSGPLPPPEALERYEALFPGFTERCVIQWESQSKHRQGLESTHLLGTIDSERRGQQFGLAASLAALLLAGYTITLGHVVEGISLAIGEAAVLAGVFVYGRNAQRAERKEKHEATS